MKNFTLIFLLAAFIAAGCAQKEPTEKTILGKGTDYSTIPESLNGKVKMVRETNFWAVEKDGKLIKGDMMTWKDLDSIGSTKNFIAYFDENGMLKQFDHFDVNNIIHDSNVGIAENGKYPRWDYTLDGKNVGFRKLNYDDMGYLTGGEGYDMKDSLNSKQIYTHDGNGNYTKNEYFDANDQKQFYQVLTLNDKFKVIELKVYNGKDSLLSKSVNSYDDKGFLIKQNSDNLIWDYKYLKFDKNGNWQELTAIIDNGKFKVFAERYYEYY